MKEKIRQFMIGRYGTDGLNQFLNIASLVLILVYILTRLPLLLYVGVVLLGLCYYRMFSRNISKRTEENYKYYAVKDRIRNKFSGLKDQWEQPQTLPLLPLPPVPPEAARSPGPGPHPDLLPPLRHPVHQEELTYVWICHPESGRAGRRGQGPLPHGLLRPLPPHRCAPRPAGPSDAELRSDVLWICCFPASTRVRASASPAAATAPSTPSGR